VTAREEVLARIRAATSVAPADASGAAKGMSVGDAAPAGYRVHGEVAGVALLDLLADRLTDYGTRVRRATPATLAAEVDAALAARGANRVVVPPAVRVQLPESAQVTVDSGLSAADLDSIDAVVTRAAVAIAETGTIVLDGSDDQGRRAITLVPDYHLCVVEARQVVHLVPEAVGRLAGAASRPLTWISGPSATSDIELERVEGVHGPRTLEVILVAPG
jgi:L-lactate dehydrogenase complex protein LldG